MRKTLGFTLIEVMISMFIMAMLTILVSTSVRTAVQNKKKIETRMEMEALLYDTLRVIRSDLDNAFHYQDVFFEMEQLALMQTQSEQVRLNPGMTPQGIQQQAPPIKLTQFIGSNNSMHFTSLSHFRTKYNAQESDQAEVGYFVDSCKNTKGSSSRCLWRRTQTPIDDKVDEDGSRNMITPSVREFRLSYRGSRENDDWVSEWRSDNKGRGDHQNKFPTLVKVTLEIEQELQGKTKSLKETVVFKIPFTNNEPHLASPQQMSGSTGRPL